MKKHCHFLDLPAELRVNIYDMHFSCIQKRATLEWIHNRYVTDNHLNEVTFFTALLFTNKQIFYEAYLSIGKYGDRLAAQLESINEDIEGDDLESNEDEESSDEEADPGSPWAQYMEDKSSSCVRRCHIADNWAYESGLKP